jgi:hypothetical protein
MSRNACRCGEAGRCCADFAGVTPAWRRVGRRGGSLVGSRYDGAHLFEGGPRTWTYEFRDIRRDGAYGTYHDNFLECVHTAMDQQWPPTAPRDQRFQTEHGRPRAGSSRRTSLALLRSTLAEIVWRKDLNGFFGVSVGGSASTSQPATGDLGPARSMDELAPTPLPFSQSRFCEGSAVSRLKLTSDLR